MEKEEECTYGECMRNHAANLGTYATDGCGEFAPKPSSLLCAACNCHRNFHRRLLRSAAPLHGTGFTPYQTEWMLRLAEKIGWRMPRGTAGDEVSEFCKEIGVGTSAFKVWMHGQKVAGASSPSSSSTSTSVVGTGTGDDRD